MAGQSMKDFDRGIYSWYDDLEVGYCSFFGELKEIKVALGKLVWHKRKEEL